MLFTITTFILYLFCISLYSQRFSSHEISYNYSDRHTRNEGRVLRVVEQFKLSCYINSEHIKSGNLDYKGFSDENKEIICVIVEIDRSFSFKSMLCELGTRKH